MKAMMNFQDLCDLGYPEGQARRIIRLAKQELVKEGFAFYNGKRVGLVPTTAITKIIALPQSEDDN
ncbi:DUF3173 family protein [Limosilactobacillus difficilis]|uniref:DUF3173 family protein n=1 Tax=Limosilactobacillus difficilis TaxID=2991838 RepID=UPI0024B9A533|nr:DUF3173 family protein [Limosilactobacillus difficilis]